MARLPLISFYFAHLVILFHLHFYTRSYLSFYLLVLRVDLLCQFIGYGVFFFLNNKF